MRITTPILYCSLYVCNWYTSSIYLIYFSTRKKNIFIWPADNSNTIGVYGLLLGKTMTCCTSAVRMWYSNSMLLYVKTYRCISVNDSGILLLKRNIKLNILMNDRKNVYKYDLSFLLLVKAIVPHIKIAHFQDLLFNRSIVFTRFPSEMYMCIMYFVNSKSDNPFLKIYNIIWLFWSENYFGCKERHQNRLQCDWAMHLDD